MTSTSEEQQTPLSEFRFGKYRDAVARQDNEHSTSFAGIQRIDREILLLCGFPSSGTDLLKNLVNAHTWISIAGEFPLLPSLAKKYAATVSKDLVRQAAADLHNIDIYRNLCNVKDLDLLPECNCSFASLYGELLTAQEVKWIGNKTPQNAEHVNSLNHLFPRAKFILIVRDVRDVVLSWHSKWGKDPLLSAAKWNDRMLYGINQLENLGTDRYLLVTFEELLRDTASVASRICVFLNLEFQPRMLDYHLYVDQVFDGKRNYGQPILSDNTGKWRTNISTPMIKRIEEIAYESMRRFGYIPSRATKGIPLRRKEHVSGRIRDIWSILFIGNRTLQGSHWKSRLRAIRLEIMKRLSIRSRQLH